MKGAGLCKNCHREAGDRPCGGWGFGQDVGEKMASPKKNRKENKSAFFNRELSWLAFNRRVLEQAEDDRYPLLERLRFLSFVSSNLDEFFEIRVSGLIQQVESGITTAGIDGLGPKEQLRRVQSVAGSLVKEQYACWGEQIVPGLREKGIFFKTRKELTRREHQWLRTYFDEQIQPVLTPLAIDPAHPFPQFANKSLYILLWLNDPDTPEIERMLAFIPVPRILPRVVRVPGTRRAPECYVFLSDVLKMFAPTLFPGYEIISLHAFRVTRNSDLYIDEEEVENLLQSIEEELYNLRKGAAVRLEIEDSVEEALLDELLGAIRLSKQFVFRIQGPLNLMRMMSVYDLIDRPDLKFPSFYAHLPTALRGPGSIYDTIKGGDLLLHHPYDSFEPVVDFVRQAAIDPQVLAIKITLYRTSSDSAIVQALMDAAKNDKQVTVLIELKARFDEANNINWAKQLDESGVHVVYGFVGLKTHCKCALVVRREGGQLVRYAHLGTGNYHPKTARLYTDMSLFTCKPEMTEDVAEVFNTLTGYAKSPSFRKVLVAPYTLHKKMNEFIAREARNAKQGKSARIMVKCNSLIDRETIESLYAASRAGVQIDLIIRGICGLVPGVKGMSENIRVRSILGRYLEHSRIYYFENSVAGEPMVWIGSADWMARNFYRRVEVVFPVEDAALRDQIVLEILPPYLKDTRAAKVLRPNGSYRALTPPKGEAPFSVQDHFTELAKVRSQTAEAAILEEAAGVAVARPAF
ncbi:MAG: polyphosphate kinase 1 [Opitutales bacterium]|nr:polyphosphate kinase 1 [Opitutales bacterium]